jgi:thioester reductase-like protein
MHSIQLSIGADDLMTGGGDAEGRESDITPAQQVGAEQLEAADADVQLKTVPTSRAESPVARVEQQSPEAADEVIRALEREALDLVGHFEMHAGVTLRKKAEGGDVDVSAQDRVAADELLLERPTTRNQEAHVSRSSSDADTVDEPDGVADSSNDELPEEVDERDDANRAFPPTWLLTGVTGFLGRHVLAAVLRTRAEHVVCIVRASDDAKARTRVIDALRRAATDDADAAALERLAAARVTVVAGNLEDGPAALPRDQLARRWTGVFHLAAKVRSWPATSVTVRDMFQHNVVPTVHLACFAALHRCPLLFASTASVIRAPYVGAEDVVTDVSGLGLFDAFAVYNAYALSKLMAEAALMQVLVELTPDNDVADRTSKSDDVAARLCISRLPLLTPPCNGSADRNEEDWLHRLVATSAALGVFPDGAVQETVDQLAVDTAASAIVARLVTMRQRQRQVRRPVKLSLLLPLTTTQICMSLLLRWIAEQ